MAAFLLHRAGSNFRTQGRVRPVPVSPPRVARALECAIAPRPRTATVAAHQHDASGLVARQHLRRRMAEAAAIAGLHHRHLRLNGVEEAVARRACGCRGAAPAAACCATLAQPRRQRRLLRRFDVAGQQHAAAGGVAHAQHARQRVGLGLSGVVGGGRMQHVERHAIPLPLLAGVAAAVFAGQRQQRMIRRPASCSSARSATPSAARRHRRRDRCRGG